MGDQALFRDDHPSRSRIKPRDPARDLRRLRAEIGLIDLPLMAHQEGLNARDAPLGGDGQHGEAADHAAIHHIIHLAAARGRPLAFQHAEEIAVEGAWRLPRSAPRISAFGRGGREGAKRARRLALGAGPIEPVALAGRGEEAPRMGPQSALAAGGAGIFIRHFDQRPQRLDRVQFVTADAPIQQFPRSPTGRSGGEHGS